MTPVDRYIYLYYKLLSLFFPYLLLSLFKKNFANFYNAFYQHTMSFDNCQRNSNQLNFCEAKIINLLFVFM